jgi:hypothetical protein
MKDYFRLYDYLRDDKASKTISSELKVKLK